MIALCRTLQARHGDYLKWHWIEVHVTTNQVPLIDIACGWSQKGVFTSLLLAVMQKCIILVTAPI